MKKLSNTEMKKDVACKTKACSVGTKFKLKQTILIFFFFFLTTFAQKKFLVENGKIALARASVVVTYYIKIFRTRADRHNGVLMSLLHLFAEATRNAAHFNNRG